MLLWELFLKENACENKCTFKLEFLAVCISLNSDYFSVVLYTSGEILNQTAVFDDIILDVWIYTHRN